MILGALSDVKHVCRGKSLRCIHHSGRKKDKVGIFKCLICGSVWTLEWAHQGTAGLVPVIRRNGRLQVIIGEKNAPLTKGVKRK